MTHIDPVDPDVVAAKGLGDEMETFAAMGDPDAVFLRILAHVPNYAEALWGAMSKALFEGGVDHRLKELIRIQLAATAADPYFSGLRSPDAAVGEDEAAAAIDGFEHDERFTDAERWALEYAHRMYRNPENVDAAFYEEGKRHWTEAQIMEMGGLIAIHYGMDVFMGTLQA